MGNACSNGGEGGLAPGEKALEGADQPVAVAVTDDKLQSPLASTDKGEDTDATPVGPTSMENLLEVVAAEELVREPEKAASPARSPARSPAASPRKAGSATPSPRTPVPQEFVEEAQSPEAKGEGAAKVKEEPVKAEAKAEAKPAAKAEGDKAKAKTPAKAAAKPKAKADAPKAEKAEKAEKSGEKAEKSGEKAEKAGEKAEKAADKAAAKAAPKAAPKAGAKAAPKAAAKGETKDAGKAAEKAAEAPAEAPASSPAASGELAPDSPDKKAPKAEPKKKAAAKEKGEVFYFLNVTILSARGLRNADGQFGGTSDPFVVCEVVGKPKSIFQTKVIYDTVTPVWNTQAEYKGVHSGDTFLFTVYDKDTFSARDLLGKATLSHTKFLPSGFAGELKLEETDGGSAVSADSYLSLKVEVVEFYSSDPKNVVCTAKKVSEGGKTPLASKDAPKLKVSIVSAHGLRNADCALNGVSDPYVICEVPGKARSRIRTPVMLDQLDPVWNYEKEICDWEPGDSLSFAVMDKDFGKTDDLLGRCSLPAEKCYPFAFEGDVPLRDCGKGIKATLTLKVSTVDPAK